MSKTRHMFRRTTRDALADLMAQRYPAGRRKALMREFRSLTEDEARAVCRGNPSASTLEKILDEGGWALVLDVFALRFGEHVSQHLAREAARHAERAEAHAAMLRALGAGGPGDRGGAGGLDRGEDRGRDSMDSRPSGRRLGGG